MTIGIIIVFHNNEQIIDKNTLIEQLNMATNLELCLVNNNSKDNTYQLLKEISYACKNVSLVNIRKFKSEFSAVRSGARFMSNKFEINHLGYACINVLNIKYNGLNDLITTICQNQDKILECDIKAINNTKLRQTLFKNLFSIIDYLKKIEVQNTFINLQTISRL